MTVAGRSPNVIWRFRDELTIRPRRKTSAGGFVLSYAGGFIKIEDSDARQVFEDLRDNNFPIVFQLIVATMEYSICTLAFDPWESEDEDYCSEDRVFYSIDDPYPVAEAVTSKKAWLAHRLSQSRNLSGLDFVAHRAKRKENKSS